MKTIDLLELIYDKLADNDEYRQFDYNEIDDMYMDYDNAEVVIGVRGTYWKLKLEKVKEEKC